MSIFNILNFILICCVGVFLYIVIKENEDAIEELYDMYYNLYGFKDSKEDKIKKRKAKVINIDKRLL